MTIESTPRRIEWAGPEGYTVWTDEDGTHLRSPGGHALEMPDVERLVALWQHAKRQTESGAIPAPKPPSRDEMRGWSTQYAEENAERRAVRAVQAEFTTSPF